MSQKRCWPARKPGDRSPSSSSLNVDVAVAITATPNSGYILQSRTEFHNEEWVIYVDWTSLSYLVCHCDDTFSPPTTPLPHTKITDSPPWKSYPWKISLALRREGITIFICQKQSGGRGALLGGGHYYRVDRILDDRTIKSPVACHFNPHCYFVYTVLVSRPHIRHTPFHAIATSTSLKMQFL